VVGEERCSRAVSQSGHARLFGAVIAAKNPAVLLQAMADDANTAMCAGWCERVNCAFEAVESMGLTLGYDLKGFIVVIPARVALRHEHLLLVSQKTCAGPPDTE